MPKLRLTDAGVRGLQTDQVQADFWDELTPGLHVRVSGKTGLKTWYVRYRANGKHRRMKIGRYPAMSLAEARARAREVKADAMEGEDPQQERKARRDPDRLTTFRALAEEVMEAKAKDIRPATDKERWRVLDNELLPAWGDRDAGEITRRDVIELTEAIADRGAPVMANRVATFIATLYNAGLDRDFPGIEYNPALRLKPGGEEDGRDRYLTRKEIKVVWNAIAHETPLMGGVFRLALLTAQRIGSVCAMRWEDIGENDVWIIPADQFKGKRAHAVPLSGQALQEIEALRPISGDKPVVFPGRADGSEPHISSHGSALRRIRERTDIPHWVAHDFRTTFRTHATAALNPSHPKDPKGLGVPPHIADAVLGHAEPSLGWQRYTGNAVFYLLAEKRDAIQRWGAFVAAAVMEEDTDA